MTDISTYHLTGTDILLSIQSGVGNLMLAAGCGFYAALKAYGNRRAEQTVAEIASHMLKDIGIGQSETAHAVATAAAVDLSPTVRGASRALFKARVHRTTCAGSSR